MCQQFPDRIADRRAMGVDLQAGALFVVPGHVQVGDPPAGHRGDVGVGVETEVAGVDVDVVDVQQQLAVGFLQYRADEIDLFQLARQARIRRDVLDDQRPLEDVLYHPDPFGDPAHRFVAERQRHQVVELAVVGAGRQVLAVGTDAMLLDETLDRAQQRHVQRGVATEVERQTMAEERQALGQLAELAAETAADADPVLRGDFEEVDPALVAGAERLQQRATQA